MIHHLLIYKKIISLKKNIPSLLKKLKKKKKKKILKKPINKRLI